MADRDDGAALRAIVEVLDAGDELSDCQRRVAADVLRELMQAAERDAWIVRCRREHFADLSARAAANDIATGFNRYRASAWRADSKEHSCPPRIRDHVNGKFWYALKALDASLSFETIRKISGF